MISDAGFQNSTTNASFQPLLILHAGTYKTASTYIQERLHLNRDLLSQQAITYQDPYFDRPKAKNLLVNYVNTAKSSGEEYSPITNKANTFY